MMDASSYNDGLRGGKIRIRARIEEFDKKHYLLKKFHLVQQPLRSLIQSLKQMIQVRLK